MCMISATDHLKWARGIAIRVLRRYHLRGDAELDDIHSAGVIEICRLAPQFIEPVPCQDAAGAFRGWVYLWVKTACEREAERLCNGGTYHARRRGAAKPVIVRDLSDDHARSAPARSRRSSLASGRLES